jgi:hypothetical protein
MSARKRNPLDEEIGGLYALPLEEFTTGRNALAAKLKKEGDAAGSGEVKALRKPTPSAWAVNQLFQRERERMDELMEAGEKARSALHEAITSGGADSLREAIQGARGLIEDLRQRALEFLTEGGRAASGIMGDRIGTNLQSLTFSPAAAEAAERGWIETDLDPPGFEVLAGLQIAAGGGARSASRPVQQAPPIRPRPAPVPAPKKATKPERVSPLRKDKEAKAPVPTRQEREEERLREWREREEARQRAQQEREEQKLRERLAAAEEEADRTAAEARDLQEEAAKAARAAAEARRAAERTQERADKAAEALRRAREALAEARQGARILSHPGAKRRRRK